MAVTRNLIGGFSFRGLSAISFAFVCLMSVSIAGCGNNVGQTIDPPADGGSQVPEDGTAGQPVEGDGNNPLGGTDPATPDAPTDGGTGGGETGNDTPGNPLDPFDPGDPSDPLPPINSEPDPPVDPDPPPPNDPAPLPPTNPEPTPPGGGDPDPLPPEVEGSISDLLEPGDRFDPVSDPAQFDQLVTEIWAVIHESNAPCWISRNSTLTQIQFYEDPSFLPGELWRYNGIEVSVGKVVWYDVGWYRNPNYAQPFQAAIIETWSGDLELLIIQDTETIVHAIIFGNGVLASFYDKGTNCL